ncbi:hypothetical protein [Crossiella sp. CA198]|uniref:hypothetical protein n=1 Tax=Crossiella sp. CA198 TaxID=3455607 RepID=UPI003F8D8C4C
MTAPGKPRRRSRLIAVLLTLILVAAAVIVYFLIPNHRTALVVDSSAAPDGFGPLAQAVGAAAVNSAAADSLSLRRFGGDCGSPASTSELVAPATGSGKQVADALRRVTAAGRSTMVAGILGAIEDFSAFYPFRGWTTNRIVVVTRQGIDACNQNEAEVKKLIQDKVAEAGLTLEFRFVGLRIPPEQQQELTQLAAAAGAPTPKLAANTAELATSLRELVLPRATEASPIAPPTSSTKPPERALVQVAVAMSVFSAEVSVNAPDTTACAMPTGLKSRRCEFTVPAGTIAPLRATISGAWMGRGHQGQPIWFGCDEKPTTVQGIPGASATCNLDLTTSGRYVCLATTDLADRGGAHGCSEIFRKVPRAPIPFGSTAPAPTK